MSDVELIFSADGSITSRVIRFLTWSRFSHVDIILPNSSNVVSCTPFQGARLEKLKDRLASASYSVICTVSVPNEGLYTELALQAIGTKYDWTALFGFLVRRDWQRSNKWFCSELAAYCIERAGTHIINKRFGRVTPQDLYESVLIRPNKFFKRGTYVNS